MKRYILHNGKNPLSYWFPNNNFCGKQKNIIGFGNRSYFSFHTKEAAKEFKGKMQRDYARMEGDLKLSLKVWNTIEKLKISES